jgi:hypothetical protein
MTTDQTTDTNGQTKPPKTPPPFRIERSLMGVADSYIQIAERVVSGDLGTNEAKEATRALNGVPGIIKVHLETIKIFEKGSEKAREQAARILDMGTTKALT